MAIRRKKKKEKLKERERTGGGATDGQVDALETKQSGGCREVDFVEGSGEFLFKTYLRG